jgi:sugar lactone lactonase YvrE
MTSLAEGSVVYVSFTHEHFIERFDTATGLSLHAPGGPGNGTGFYVTSVSNPTGLALDRNGNLYAAGLANGVIDEIPLLGAISQSTV